MTQSVELLLDAPTEAAVQAEWDALAAAGLPSLAHHRAPSNRPHVTLLACPVIAAEAEEHLRTAAAVLPLPLRLGALACLGRGPYVLVRLVVADVALLRLQQQVVAIASVSAEGHYAAGAWTPHVTLASRLAAAEVATALEVLGGGVAGLTGRAQSCRRWDGDARREWSLNRR